MYLKVVREAILRLVAEKGHRYLGKTNEIGLMRGWGKIGEDI